MSAPDPTQPGPYTVATCVREELHDTARDRTIQATVYYPTDAPQPSPLIMLSHGFTAHMGAYSFLGKGLAAHGYVVVCANHVGDTTSDVFGFFLDSVVVNEKGQVNWTGTFQNIMKTGYKLATNSQFYKRPADISFLIDCAEKWSAGDADLQDKIDMSRIGMTGHSFGGYTTFAVAGATIDLAGMHARIAEERDKSAGESPFAALAGASRDAGRFMDQMATAPEAQHHGDEISFRDERVQACIALAPASQGFQHGLEHIAIPAMVMAGTKDPLYDPDNTSAYRYLTPPKYWALFKDAGHMLFNDDMQTIVPEELRRRAEDMGLGGMMGTGGSPAPSMMGNLMEMGSYPLADGHALIVILETAFFNKYLKEDAAADSVLTQEFVKAFSDDRAEFDSQA